MQPIFRSLLPLALAVLANDCYSAELTLAWDAVPDERVVYYELSWGASAGNYQSSLESDTTIATATGLAQGQAYYFAVRACAAGGTLCSPFSEEIMATAPVDVPRAVFSISGTVGIVPHTATYLNASTGIIEYYHWDFGDGATSSAESPQHTYESPGVYTVKLTATGPGGTSTAIKGDAVQVQEDSLNFPTHGGDAVVDEHPTADSPPAELPKLEFGEATINRKWQRVHFEEPFAQPIVVVTPTRARGRYQSMIRLDSVDGAGFYVRLLEASHQKQLHGTEAIRYIAVERGLHQLPGGTLIEADQVDIGRSPDFSHVPFGLSFSNTPVVLTNVVGESGVRAMATRLGQVTSGGFEAILDPRNGIGGVQVRQTLNYIAWEPSVVDAEGARIVAAYTCKSVAGAPRRVDLETTFAAPPVLLTTTQTKPRNRSFRAGLCMEVGQSKDEQLADMRRVLGGYVAIGEPVPAGSEARDTQEGQFGDRKGGWILEEEEQGWHFPRSR